MNSKIFSEAMGELDIRYVDEALNYKKKSKKHIWIGGAAAACLCLVAAGGVVLARQNVFTPGGISTSDNYISGGEDIAGGGNEDNDSFAPGGGVTIPGDDTGGMDNVIEGGTTEGHYSVAVYPDTESEENVETEDVISLTESEALGHPLGDHLPKQLPEGFHYGRGSLYATVMKDGTKYNMLRVEYLTGEIPEQQFTEDGGAIAPPPGVFGDSFIVIVFDFLPGDHIYSSREEITLPILEKEDVARIRAGECYVSVFTETADPSSVLEALKSIE